MRYIERIGYLNADIEHLVQRQRNPLDPLAQALAFEQLHGDEPLPGALLDGVNRADVWMIES